MKKLLLFVATAMLSAAMSFAQEVNLALGGTATASSGNAGAAIDNNEGSRWESASTDDTWWALDLGSPKTFNTIQIMWEGAYSKSFTIEVSEDGENYTPVVNVEDVTLTGFPNTQNYTFDGVTARYIKFTNIARGTGYGVSFWEFRVFNVNEESVLTYMALSADKVNPKVGEAVTLTSQCKDQMGSDIDAGDVTYECTPADAGTFEGNAYTPAKSGAATIVAKAGGLTSNEIVVSGWSGEKINIFSHWQSMVTPINKETTTGSMVGAFDDNMESLWELHAESGGSDAERTYTCGFQIDFGALWDVTAFSASYEGACPQDYTVVAVDNEGNETELLNVQGPAGIRAYSEFYVVDAKNTRFIKWVCTKAATQHGVKIYDFSVYGENQQELPDTQAPTDFTASIVEGSESLSSVALNLKATDDVSSIITYKIAYVPTGDTAAPTIVTASGHSGENTVFTVNGLNSGVTYDFTVKAMDAKGNVAANVVNLQATTKTITAAPVPTVDAANVMSVFSDTYGNAPAWGHNPNWGQATVCTIIDIDGNKTISMVGLNYQGHEFQMMDVSAMEYLHVDIYPVACNSVRITPIWRNEDANANFPEIPYELTGLTPNEWNSIDIPLSVFADDARQSTNKVYQIKWDLGNNNTFLVDNIYFGKSSSVDEEAPVWFKAEASDVADVKADLLLQATDNNTIGTLTYTVLNGAEVVATAQAQQGVETTVTVKDLEPETDYTLTVAVKDAAGNEGETRTIKFITTAKVEAPTSGEDVIIVQNDVITNPQELRYTWSWTQDENNNVTFSVSLADGVQVDGLLPTVVYMWDWTKGFREVSGNELTWSNCNEGDVLKAQAMWPVTGGRAISDYYTYTVVDKSTPAVDEITAEEISETNGFNLTGSGSLDHSDDAYLGATWYDATALTGSAELTVANPNALIIITPEQAETNAITHNANEVVKGSSLTAEEINIDDDYAFSFGHEINCDAVTYTRANSDRMISGIYPFDIVADENVFVFEDFDGLTLKYKSVKDATIPAYTPVIIDAKNGDVNMQGVDISKNPYTGTNEYNVQAIPTGLGPDNLHFGYTTTTVNGKPHEGGVSDYEMYAWAFPDGGTGEFLHITGTSTFTLKPFRAIFLLNAGIGGNGQSAMRQLPSSLQITINGMPLAQYLNETSGAELNSVDANNANAPLYNIQGQRVNGNYRGIVIENGTKRVNRK